jgi:hypothetical protein
MVIKVNIYNKIVKKSNNNNISQPIVCNKKMLGA